MNCTLVLYDMYLRFSFDPVFLISFAATKYQNLSLKFHIYPVYLYITSLTYTRISKDKRRLQDARQPTHRSSWEWVTHYCLCSFISLPKIHVKLSIVFTSTSYILNLFHICATLFMIQFLPIFFLNVNLSTLYLLIRVLTSLQYKVLYIVLINLLNSFKTSVYACPRNVNCFLNLSLYGRILRPWIILASLLCTNLRESVSFL